MRGALFGERENSSQGRIIPADAGSTSDMLSPCLPCRDHPRGCGEHGFIDSHIQHTEGSSPRMRGAPKEQAQTLLRERIIPADAGSTWHLQIAYEPHPDHPRGCGEHGWELLRRNCHSGSSPRMRGALSQNVPVVTDRRIIPADAGSTSGWPNSARIRQDHPRGCGEHGHSSLSRLSPWGSSPRMRGARPRTCRRMV